MSSLAQFFLQALIEPRSSKEKMRTSTFIINQSEARGMRHFLLKEKPPAGVKEKPPAGVKEKPPQG